MKNGFSAPAVLLPTYMWRPGERNDVLDLKESIQCSPNVEAMNDWHAAAVNFCVKPAEFANCGW
jgi:hypothetical protein